MGGTTEDGDEPSRLLCQPSWWLALIVLLLNDHVLKRSALIPELSGKLSDFAGLIVAPPLAAILVARCGKRVRVLAFAMVVVLFTAVKTVPSCARLLEVALISAGVPSRLWVDPTDLVALLVLPWTWRLAFGAVPAPRIGERAARVLHRVAVIAGAFACVATSNTPYHSTHAYVVNATRFPLEVKVSRFSVPFDCEAFAGRERFVIRRDLFALEGTYLVGPLEVLPLDEAGAEWENGERVVECGAVLLEAPGMESFIVGWAGVQDAAPAQFVDSAEVYPQNVVLRAAGEAVVPAVGESLLRLDPDDLTDEPACAADAGQPLEWSGFQPGNFTIDQVEESTAGCLRIHLSEPRGGDAGVDRTVAHLCAPPEAFPFTAGDAVAVSGGYADRLQVEAVSGATRRAEYGQRLVPEIFAPVDCEGVGLECGALVLPITVEVPDVLFRTEAFGAGDSVTLEGPVRRTQIVLRAEQVLRVGTGCGVARDAFGPTYDWVFIEQEVLAP